MSYDYYFGIASYHRKDRQPMLAYLRSMGVPPDRIIMSVQTSDDLYDYLPLYGQECIILYKEGSNVSMNKNTILNYMEKNHQGVPIIMCSDKVRGIRKMVGKNTIAITKEEFQTLCRKGIAITRKLSGGCFGVYSVGNTYFMEHSISTNRQILGCFMGILDTSMKFDERLVLKEDLGYVCQCISAHKRVVRFNDISLDATFHTQGGCHNAWNSENDKVHRDCIKLLLTTYPTITATPTRTNGIRLTAKSRKIKATIL